MRNSDKPESERPEFPLDEIYAYQDELRNHLFDKTDFFTYSKPVCGHCGKESAQMLHYSVFKDRCAQTDEPGFILLGTHERISILCDGCWDNLMESLEQYMRTRKYPKKPNT